MLKKGEDVSLAIKEMVWGGGALVNCEVFSIKWC